MASAGLDSLQVACLDCRKEVNVKLGKSVGSKSISSKSISSRLIWIFAIALVGLSFLLLSASASAQSCALCYTQAASSGARMIQALKSGILILIAPPTFMTVGVLFVCYRKRNQTMKANGAAADDDWAN
jgi:hypothetical protein